MRKNNKKAIPIRIAFAGIVVIPLLVYINSAAS
ncbi:hypothetical protein J2S16_004618 [Cytobacillus kochii]|nr:hypothetical protein [Cytobacillus kochii]